MERNTTGARFERVGVQRGAFLSQVMIRIGPEVRDFCERFFDLCDALGTDDAFTPEVEQATGKKRSTLLANMKKLQDEGLAEKGAEPTAKGKRPRTIHRFMLDAASNLPAPPPQQKSVDALDGNQLRELTEKYTNRDLFWHGDTDSGEPKKVERKTVSAIVNSLGWSTRGVRGRGSYKTRVWMGSRFAEIKVSSDEGIPATITDIPVLSAAMTMMRRYYQSTERADWKSIVSAGTDDLCRILDLDVTPANRRRVTDSLYRWKRTSFTLENYFSKDGFGYFFYERSFSFLADIMIDGYLGAEGKTPLMVSFAFNPTIGQALLEDKAILSVHNEILTRRHPQPIWTATYFWARRVIQKTYKRQFIEWKRLQRELHGDLSMKEFRRAWKRMMEAEGAEEGIFKVPGYLVKTGKEGVWFAADPEDPINKAFARHRATEQGLRYLPASEEEDTGV